MVVKLRMQNEHQNGEKILFLRIKTYLTYDYTNTKLSNQGPQKLGDPNFRGLTKMEEDPLIPQRMRDIARTTFCDDFSEAVNKCGSEAVSS